MTIKSIIVIGLVCFSLYTFEKALSANEGLLGRNYIEGGLSSTQPDGYNKSILEISGPRNYCLTQNLDFVYDINYSWINGKLNGEKIDFRNYTISAELRYQFSPNTSINPFVGTGVGISSQANVNHTNYTTNSKTDIPIIIRMGLEIIPEKSFLFIPSVVCTSVNGNLSTVLNASLGYWVTTGIIPKIIIAYDRDIKNTILGISVGILL